MIDPHATLRRISPECRVELRAYLDGIRATGQIVIHDGSGAVLIEEQLRTILGRHSVRDVRPLVEFDLQSKHLAIEFVDSEGRPLLLHA